MTNPAPTTPPPPRRLWPYWILPLVCLLLLEILVRIFVVKPFWYEQAEAAVRAYPIDYLFIGSSRVAAGIDTATFESAMATHLGRPVRALNLGMGYSNYAQHLVGLQRLVDAAPDHLKNVTVLIEAPGGIGDLGNWGGSWYSEGQAHLLLGILRPRDLAIVWRTPAPLGQKLGVTGEWLWGRSMLLSRRELLHRRIQQHGELLTARLLSPLHLPATASSTTSNSGLGTAGGVLADTQGIHAARTFAGQFVNEQLAAQHPTTLWDSSLYASLRGLLDPLGGRVLFYRMPESSVFHPLYASQIGRANLASFQQHFPQMRSIMLEPNFAPDDTDFPDLWHLKQTRARDFTRALADALIAADPPRLR